MLTDMGIIDIAVKSCGVSACEGMLVSENAVLAAREYGADISSHTALPFTPDLVTDSSVFVCVSYSHMIALFDFVPREQLFVLDRNITDPYLGDLETYRRCAKEIYDALQDLPATLGIEQ